MTNWKTRFRKKNKPKYKIGDIIVVKKDPYENVQVKIDQACHSTSRWTYSGGEYHKGFEDSDVIYKL